MKNHWINKKKYHVLAEKILKNLNIQNSDYIEKMVEIANENSSKGIIVIGQKMAYYALVRYAICTKKSKSPIWKV